MQLILRFTSWAGSQQRRYISVLFSANYVLRSRNTYCSLGVLKKNVAALSSEIIRKQKEVFTEESNKYTFVLRTKDIKFDCEMLGKSK